VITLALFLAAADPAVIVLPLLPDGTVSVKQAQGLTAQVRDAVEKGGYAKLLSTSKDDQKQAEQCQRDARCLGNLADVRGADYVIAGIVSPASDGLRVAVVVAGPNAVEALRRVEVTMKGDDADVRRIDRLARNAIDPAALRGSLMVLGEEGASVVVDGKTIGTLPLDKPIENLSEGDHALVVSKAGYLDDKRTIQITHNETTEYKAVLMLPADGQPASPVARASAPASEGVSTPVVVGGIGAGLVVLGGVAGALSLRDALDVEQRAREQNLFFPRDSGLILRGNIFAWTANALYATGAVALGAAGVLMFTGDDP
jgi:hypothetical protein